MSIFSLLQKVEAVLRDNPSARNSDTELTAALWKTFHPSFIFINSGGAVCVRLSDLSRLPQEDQIARCRRKIQNDMLRHLPTDPAVAKARRINEQVWRDAMTAQGIVATRRVIRI